MKERKKEANSQFAVMDTPYPSENITTITCIDHNASNKVLWKASAALSNSR